MKHTIDKKLEQLIKQLDNAAYVANDDPCAEHKASFEEAWAALMSSEFMPKIDYSGTDWGVKPKRWLENKPLMEWVDKLNKEGFTCFANRVSQCEKYGQIVIMNSIGRAKYCLVEVDVVLGDPMFAIYEHKEASEVIKCG